MARTETKPIVSNTDRKITRVESNEHTFDLKKNKQPKSRIFTDDSDQVIEQKLPKCNVPRQLTLLRASSEVLH